MSDYNAQEHHAHQHRKEGRRSPQEVLSWVKGMRYREEDLDRAFFSTRFRRTLDALGYVCIMRYRLYGEEGLAGREADLWLQEDSLTVEYGGEALSCYEVDYDATGGKSSYGKLREVKSPTLFESSLALDQLKLFSLAEVLGDEGWIKVLKLEEYASRQPHRQEELQQVLFPYTEAI